MGISDCFQARAGELAAEDAKLLTRGRVTGLGIGAGRALPVVIEAGVSFEVGTHSQVENGVGALIDRAHRSDAGLAHHGSVHVGRGVQAVDGNAGISQFLGEIESEHDLRQLALAIGAHAAIAACQHDIGEVDGLLTDGGNVDDAGGAARLQ